MIHILGFNGNKVWIFDPQNFDQGDSVCYHDLVFCFFAMPFVLGDKGIQYGATEDLGFEGKSYPGINITYDNGIGTTPKDEYYIHYDPETYQMVWLYGYLRNRRGFR